MIDTSFRNIKVESRVKISTWEESKRHRQKQKDTLLPSPASFFLFVLLSQSVVLREKRRGDLAELS